MLGRRGMVGLIVPSNNNVVLPEFYSALPDGVTAYETRMRVAGDLTFEAVRKMTEDAEAAAELLHQTGVDLICYCCMASTIIKGLRVGAGAARALCRQSANGSRIREFRSHRCIDRNTSPAARACDALSREPQRTFA